MRAISEFFEIHGVLLTYAQDTLDLFIKADSGLIERPERPRNLPRFLLDPYGKAEAELEAWAIIFRQHAATQPPATEAPGEEEASDEAQAPPSPDPQIPAGKKKKTRGDWCTTARRRRRKAHTNSSLTAIAR